MHAQFAFQTIYIIIYIIYTRTCITHQLLNSASIENNIILISNETPCLIKHTFKSHIEKWPIHRWSSCYFFQIEFLTNVLCTKHQSD